MNPSKPLSSSTLFVVLTIAACAHADPGNTGVAPRFPSRIGAAGDATQAPKVGVLTPGLNLSMALDRTPTEASPALTACWTVPAGDVPLAHAICSKDQQKTVEITAANVRFSCLNDPRFATIPAAEPVAFDTCQSYDVYGYQFLPALQLVISP